jgi:UDP-N-acetylglucosamine--N-acetylmuramyl-(pentapeptide) pyrophosphoryl-undecaprenol N-acetylglucosamine transferase
MASQFIHDENVSLVIGLGGYASVPMARAARRRGVPLVLLEQNATAGRATRWLASGAAAVCVAFDETQANLRSNVPVRVVGNPVRPEFLCAPAHAGKSHRHRLVVLGGSQGSADLNKHAPRAIYKVHRLLSGWQVVHVAGQDAVEPTQDLYCKLSISAEVLPFVADMSKLLADASLAVCRAGGTTLAELAVMGVPAALVPLPHATANHQRLNADCFASAGAGVTVDGRDLPGRLDDNLAATLLPLLSNPHTLDQMARRMLKLARPNATSDVVHLIRQLLGRQQRATAA